ncbi:hypothetical protein [Mycobacteroides abscessus]|uniref:hypothetical protein n=1 Tax=Mycobacteroides abscessus TaxID=36809 RepID=UPI0009A8A7E2|nr:hypothetical protein [Mycobacteroides abscessus]SLJ76203.1 Uncharacterised protein [Mycobacteroides abscessus subsp. abscessus]SLJ80603.1 Uncharacterised protein [Mycobacteroides abscessus subsp. abscessus]
MSVTNTLAAGDIFQGVVSLWDGFRVPGSIGLTMAGIIGAIVGYNKGFGHAAGKLIGGIALAACALGAVGLVNSVEQTVDKHGGHIMSGQYGG